MEPLKTGDKTTLSNQCASDPVVQAEVAKLAAGKPYYCYLQSMRVHRAYVALSIIVRPLTNSCSYYYHQRCFELHYHWLVGLCKLLLVVDVSAPRLMRAPRSHTVLGPPRTHTRHWHLGAWPARERLRLIAVTTFWKHLPGGYWLLVIGPVVEGFLGGLATGNGCDKRLHGRHHGREPAHADVLDRARAHVHRHGTRADARQFAHPLHGQNDFGNLPRDDYPPHLRVLRVERSARIALRSETPRVEGKVRGGKNGYGG